MFGVGVLLLLGAWDLRDERRSMGDPDHVAELAVVAGVLDGPGALADAFHVTIGPGEEILVAQSTANEIAVFGANGDFGHTIGRSGQGPGEFSQLGRIGWLGDTLWTLDVVGRRVHLWDRSLEYVRTTSLVAQDPPSGAGAVFPGPPLADGTFLGIPVMVDDRDDVPVLRLSESGVIEGVLVHASNWGRTFQVELGTEPFPTATVANPWADFPLWLNSADGQSIVLVQRRVAADATEGAIRIVRVNLDGDTIVDQPLTYRPEPVDQRSADGVIRRMAVGLAESRSLPTAQVERAIRDALTPPRFSPAVRELVVGRDGTIWLNWGSAVADSVDWQMLDEAAGHVGRVRLPADFDLHGGEVDRVWGVSRGEFDVPFVHVYELRPVDG